MSYLSQNIDFLRNTGKVSINDDPRFSELEEIARQLGIDVDTLCTYDLRSDRLKWDTIEFIFLDVDGVMTEGGMFYTASGDEFKRFDTKDGMAIKVGRQHGLEFGIISSGVNETIIKHRADMFGIEHVYVGTQPKLEVAQKWLNELNLSWDNVAYIGDDVNDLSMFDKSAIAVCPSDATIPIKRAADFVLLAKGGHGCIREFMRAFPQLKDKL